eukprot:1053666-Prymnesium_polylepis.1
MESAHGAPAHRPACDGLPRDSHPQERARGRRRPRPAAAAALQRTCARVSEPRLRRHVHVHVHIVACACGIVCGRGQRLDSLRAAEHLPPERARRVARVRRDAAGRAVACIVCERAAAALCVQRRGAAMSRRRACGWRRVGGGGARRGRAGAAAAGRTARRAVGVFVAARPAAWERYQHPPRARALQTAIMCAIRSTVTNKQRTDPECLGRCGMTARER